MRPPEVSILIPTLNGERDLAKLVPALRAQRFPGGFECLAIDSSSDDGTVALLRGGGFDVEVIPRSEFGHGRTRNRLAVRAKGRALVFLSQDALPRGEDFLGELVAALDDPAVAGAVARVVAGPGVDALTARTVDGASEASTQPWRHALPPERPFRTLPAGERADLMRFNNVASCIRADVLAQHPFPEVPFGEDCAWAARVLDAGWHLVSRPAAVVEHAHRYGPAGAWRRYRTDAEFHLAFHAHRVRPTLTSVVRGIGYELVRDLSYAFRERFEPLALLRAPFLRSAQVIAQYAGGRRPSEVWREPSARGETVTVEPSLGQVRSPLP